MQQWLVEEKFRKLAAERYHDGYKAAVIQPVDAVVYHYTGSTRASGTARWLTMDDDYFISVHFLVERDGTVRQFIPLNERGAHAGGKTSKLFGGGNVNGRTIGIEIMNVGPIVPDGDGWKTLSKKKFDGVGVSAGGKHPGRDSNYEHTQWEAYGPEQMAALVGLTKQLCTEFPILLQGLEERLTGHENVDPSRKTDPGPAFPWKIIHDAAREVETIDDVT